jgi:hypothetical protein
VASPLLARSRALVRPGIHGVPARRRCRAPALAFGQMRAPESRSAARLLWTTFGRVDLIDADARIRLAMQACRALTSALLQVVQGSRPSRRDEGPCIACESRSRVPEACRRASGACPRVSLHRLNSPSVLARCRAASRSLRGRTRARPRPGKSPTALAPGGPQSSVRCARRPSARWRERRETEHRPAIVCPDASRPSDRGHVAPPEDGVARAAPRACGPDRHRHAWKGSERRWRRHAGEDCCCALRRRAPRGGRDIARSFQRAVAWA